jgi:hypothetical protein
MSISFSCACGKTFQVREEHAGKRAKCSACGQVNVLPGKVTTTAKKSRGSKDAARSKPGPVGLSVMALISLVLGLGTACLVGAMLVMFYLEIYLEIVSDLNELVFFGAAVLSFLTSGLGLGIAAWRRISQSDGRLTGKGLAIAGIVTGMLGIVLDLLILLALVLPVFLKVRDAAGKTSRANLSQQLDVLTCRFHNDRRKTLPDGRSGVTHLCHVPPRACRLSPYMS